MQGTILSNRYLIAEEIGIGGMGSVYRATDLRTGGAVAVKVPHTFLARNVEYMERLRREAQIAASVYSPRVVRVVDFYEHEGVPYLVMEYVPGETLAEVARQQGRFALAETLALGLEVARALDAAHAKGVIHRDLKPQNIKLVEGEVKVLDFGIAKGEGFANVTAASVFMGTPEYCAPERGVGEGDIRSDIYSLGVILYEMYEGHLPFQAATPLALMKQHETAPAPPLTGEVPEALQEIIAKCLAKDPADRYQTPRELVRALRVVAEITTGVLPAITATTAELDGVGAALGRRPSPSLQRRTIRSLAWFAALSVVIAVVAISLLLLRGRDDSPSAGAVAEPTNTPAGTTSGQDETERTPTATGLGSRPPAVPPLLVVGEPRTFSDTQFVSPAGDECSDNVKVILRLTSIRLDATGRVIVSYTLEVPRVEGYACTVDYDPDAACDCMTLQTRLASGRVASGRLVGGGGVASTGAQDIYGLPPLTGEWWFDGVALDGESLEFLRFLPENRDVPAIRLPLLRRQGR
jgi:predicted Ser/Thr protein kinase